MSTEEEPSPSGGIAARLGRPFPIWVGVWLGVAGGYLITFAPQISALWVVGPALAVLTVLRSPPIGAGLAGFAAAGTAATAGPSSYSSTIGVLAIAASIGVASAAIAVAAARSGDVSRRRALGVAVVLVLVLSTMLPGLDLRVAQAGPTETADLDSRTVDALDAYLRDAMTSRRIPGAQVAVVQNGAPTFVRAYGVADSSGTEMTTETPVLLASVSKSFTGIAMLQLVEQGLVDLDDPVTEYLPWFEVDDPRSGDITVRHLMDQVSGIRTVDGILVIGRPAATLEAEVRGMADVPLAEAPGGSFRYSNLNLEAAGHVIEVVSGQDFESYVQANILDPLGMRNSTVAPDPATVGLDRASGHQTWFGLFPFPKNEDRTPAVAPAGGVSSTATDMAQYALAHLGSGRVGETEILGADTIAEMHQADPGKDRFDESIYSMGVNLDAAEGKAIITHGGAEFGTNTGFYLRPIDDLGVVVLINQLAFSAPGAGVLAQGVVDILDGKAPADPGRSYALSYLPIGLINALILGLLARAIVSTVRWNVVRRRRAPWRLVGGGIVVHVVIPIAILLGVPAASGFPWDVILQFLVDFPTLLLVSAFTLLVTGVIKLARSLVGGRRPGEDQVPAGADPLAAEAIASDPSTAPTVETGANV